MTVGLGYVTQVGTIMNTAVGIMQTEQVGRIKKSFVGKSYSISVGDTFEISVGSSKITMTEDSISITAKTIMIAAENKNVIIGKDVLINPPGAASLSSTVAPAAAPPTGGSGDSTPQGASGEPLIVTGLGEEVDQIISKSPTLVKNINELKANGWKINNQTAGAGTTTDRINSIIYIDPDNMNNINYIVGAVAHEGGHAQYPFEPDWSGGLDPYLAAHYKDEGFAMFTEIEARNEILANGGPDIGSWNEDFPTYLSLYNKHKDNPDQAYQIIGNAYAASSATSNTGEPYPIYYQRSFHDAGGGSRWARKRFYKEHGETKKNE